VRDRVDLEAVVAVVDACHVLAQLEDDIAREQIVFADRIIVNKSSAASAAQRTTLKNVITALNPTALVEFTNHCAIDTGGLLGVRSFSLDSLLAIEPNMLDEDVHDHEHDSAIASCAFVVEGEVDPDKFNRWVNQLVQAQGQQLLRMKGVLNMHGEGRRLHFHSVHMLMDTRFGKAWARDEPRENRFVIIGRGIDEVALRDGLFQCIDPVELPCLG